MQNPLDTIARTLVNLNLPYTGANCKAVAKAINFPTEEWVNSPSNLASRVQASDLTEEGTAYTPDNAPIKFTLSAAGRIEYVCPLDGRTYWVHGNEPRDWPNRSRMAQATRLVFSTWTNERGIKRP